MAQDANEKYRRVASSYDRWLAPVGRLRRNAIGMLGLSPGETVVDVGCGTGASFSALRSGVGEQGRIIGIEQSPDMLALARRRLEEEGWSNVTLIESSAEAADIGTTADAAVFFLTHDLMRSEPAIDAVLGQLTAAGRVLAVGSKWAPWWAVPVNVAVGLIARRYVTTFEGFAAPYTVLQERLDTFTVKPVMFGGGYVGVGSHPRAPR